MTEEQWLSNTNTEAMVEEIRGKVSERKLRLFACACCRSVRRDTDQDTQKGVEVAERYADGLAKDRERAALRNALAQDSPARLALERTKDYVSSVRGCAWWTQLAFCGDANWQSAALRDVVGNPFRSVVLAPSLRTPTVISLARAAYDERLLPSGELDPARLVVLADALEEIDCTAAILEHLRSAGPHVRGCWPLDLLLGRG